MHTTRAATTPADVTIPAVRIRDVPMGLGPTRVARTRVAQIQAVNK